MNECRKNQWPPKKKVIARIPEGRHNLPARAGNFYLNLMFFLLFSCIFPLVLMQTFIFRNFSKMLIFCIFLLRSTLEWFWIFGARILFLFYQNFGRDVKRKRVQGFDVQINIRIPNLEKTDPATIFESNVEFHPKGATGARRKESASHHF